MNKIRTGDICPLCGQRITTTDPENLRLLSLLCDSLGLETLSNPYDGVKFTGEKAHDNP